MCPLSFLPERLFFAMFGDELFRPCQGPQVHGRGQYISRSSARSKREQLWPRGSAIQMFSYQISEG